MNEELTSIFESATSLSDLARKLYGKENYTNREKCKLILQENGINWEEWLKGKKE